MADNLIIIGGVIYVLAVILYFIFKKEEASFEDETEDIYSVKYLIESIKDKMNELTNTSQISLNISRSAMRKEEVIKLQLIRAVRACSYGDMNSKQFIKDYIKKLIQRDFGITEENINRVIAFDQDAELKVTDKFDILLFLYKKEYGLNALYHMITENGFDRLKGNGTREDEYRYEVTDEEIDVLYAKKKMPLSFPDRLEIVTQRVYAGYLGNGVIDEIRDMKKLDGVSAGLSGLSRVYYNYLEEYMVTNRESLGYYYNSIWIMFQGKTIHLSFLGFGSAPEMIRVAKKIYRFDEPGYLSEDKGYIINTMSDGSRIVVVRPKVAENWAFFIRKLNSIEDIAIEKLITDKNADLAIKVMGWLVKGCCTIAVTGKQFSGKTTLLKALVEFINTLFNIRIQEMVFELYIKNIKNYRNRNVMTLRDTPTVGGQQVMDLFKKTDGDAYIFGEVHSPDACSLVVQGALSGTRQLIFSHHAKTTEALIDSFKVALLQTGVFSSEMAAEEQAARAINFDFHMNTTLDGHIYLERITEIMPDRGRPYPESMKDCLREFFTRITNEKRYRIKDIVVFRDGEYVLTGVPSQCIRDRLSEFLPENEMLEYDTFFRSIKGESA